MGVSEKGGGGGMLALACLLTAPEVCVSERERDRERQRDRETERGADRKADRDRREFQRE